MNKIDYALASFELSVKEPKIMGRIESLQHAIIPFAFNAEAECRNRVYTPVLTSTVNFPFIIGEKLTSIHEL